MDLREYVKFENKKAYLKLKITPKSPKNEFFGVLENGTLKFRIKGVPEKGLVNKEIIKFLSKTLKINKSNIEITSGKISQNKIILIKEK
ncbi:MAG: DUF167 domain-containing protein [Candidatus Gracilibacteria bacterium]|nr:DUF167 domain-containing protein [Candidatus Gracilibacteria bacterium]